MKNSKPYKDNERLRQKWKVCVRCYTFNHAPYIKDTMDGFTIQKTDFPYVCCIVDDASIDGEQKVIKKYIDTNFDFVDCDDSYIIETDFGYKIFARHKINHNCHFAVILLKKNHNNSRDLKAKKRSYIAEWEKSCEYEAICEGDDYWTDPQKLQKQINFLDSHEDFTLCFHRVRVEVERGMVLSDDIYDHLKEKEYNEDELLSRLTIPTCSAVMRYDIINKKPINPNFQYGDNVLWMTCLREGKIYCIGDEMGVYRRHKGSWTTGDAYTANTKQVIHFKALMESFGWQNNPTLNKHLSFYLAKSFLTGIKSGKISAFSYFREGVSKYKIFFFKSMFEATKVYFHSIFRRKNKSFSPYLIY